MKTRKRTSFLGDTQRIIRIDKNISVVWAFTCGGVDVTPVYRVLMKVNYPAAQQVVVSRHRKKSAAMRTAQTLSKRSKR